VRLGSLSPKKWGFSLSANAFACRVAVFICLLPLPLARAQAAADEGRVLLPGARVRVTLASEPTSGGKPLVGQLASMDRDSLSLDVVDSEKRELRRDAIVRLEKSVRASRRPAGALIGFGVGFVAAFLHFDRASEGHCLVDIPVCAVVSGLAALPAAALGALVAPGEEWAEVKLRSQARAPLASDTGLQLRLVPVVGRRTGLTLVASF
jgi:hypothetical protein